MRPAPVRDSPHARRAKRTVRHVLSRDFYEWGVRKGLVGAPQGPGRPAHLLARVRQRYAFAFERESRAFDACLAELGARAYASDDEMVRAVTDRVCAFANALFTRAELEARYNRPEARLDGGIELNCILECQPSEKNPSLLKLHLRPTSRMTAATLREAFRGLARRVEQEPAFQRIETICVTSWIVVEHPGLIRRLGFTLVPARTPGTGYAHMSRATLRERYGAPDG